MNKVDALLATKSTVGDNGSPLYANESNNSKRKAATPRETVKRWRPIP